MADFDTSLSYTLLNEGGAAFTNNPLDRGGPTKFGVTLAAWSEYCGAQKTADDVKNLSLELVRPFYRHRYWLPLNLDLLGNDWVATVCFDMGVNMGVAQAAKLMQRAANITPVDGKIGPKSVAAINGMNKPAFLWAFFEQAQNTYISFAQLRPDQVGWLPNWLSRSRKIIGPILTK